MGRKRKKRRRVIFLIIMLAVICGSIYAYFNFRPVVANKYEVSQKISIKNTIHSYTVLGNKLVIFENKALKVYDHEEKIQSKKIDFNVEDVTISMVGEKIFLVDSKSGKIIIWNDILEVKKEIDLDEVILLVKEDKMHQYLGILTKKADGAERILLVNKDGDVSGEIDGLKDGKVIDFAIDSRNGIAAISAVSYSQEYKTNLMITDIQGKITGGKIFEDEMIPKIFLTKQGNIICVGTNRIIKLNNDKEIEWENTIEVDKIGYCELNDALVICDEGLRKTKVTLLDSQNSVLHSTSIDGKVKGIRGNSIRTILYGKRTICDVNKLALSETKIYKDIQWADVRQDGHIVMCNDKTVEVLRKKQ